MQRFLVELEEQTTPVKGNKTPAAIGMPRMLLPRAHTLFDQMLVHNNYIKTNNTYIIFDYKFASLHKHEA